MHMRGTRAAVRIAGLFLTASAFGAPVYLDQLENLKLKTLNGRSLRGTGLDVVAADAQRTVVDVTDYGAVGNGRTDDTAALMAAREAAVASGCALYLPRRGNGETVYLTRKGIVMASGLRLTADPGVVLASASAVLEGGGHTLHKVILNTVKKGDTSVVVHDVGGLVVGQEITIVQSTGTVEGYSETLGDITAIDAETRTVSFSNARFSADGKTNDGAKNNYGSAMALLTDFALVKTCYHPDAVNCTVENLTLRPYGNPADPYVYTISPIHQTAQNRPSAQNTFYVRNVTIDGSTHDGISVQGSGDIFVEGCTVRDVKHKGIHWGTTCDKCVVRNNFCLRCGSAEAEAVSNNGGTGGLYFCYNNRRVILEGNHLKDCYKGVFGFNAIDAGGSDKDPIIANNVFDNCTVFGLKLECGFAPNVSGNVFRRFGGTSVPICLYDEYGSAFKHRLFNISGNVIGEFANDWSSAEGAIAVFAGSKCVVSGNVIEKNPSAPGLASIRVSHTVKSIVADNVTGDSIEQGEGNEGLVLSGNTQGVN